MSLRGDNARRSAVLVLLALSFTDVRATAANATPDAAAFGALPAQTQPALSPDGHWLAWIDYQESRPRVVIFDVEARRLLRTMQSEKNAVGSVAWCSNRILLILTSETGRAASAAALTRYRSQVVAVDVTTGDGKLLLSPGAYLVASRISKPDTVIMAEGTQLLEVEARTGNGTMIKMGNEHTIGWAVGRDGLPLAREDWDWHSREYRVYALLGNSIKELLRRNDSDPPVLKGVLADGRALVLLAPHEGHQAAWALPLDGSPLRLLVDVPGVDVTDVGFDANTGAVIGVYVGGEESSVRWLDQVVQTHYESLTRAFPGKVVRPYGWTEDGTRTLVRVTSPSSPPVYYLTDFKTHRADIAAEEYPALAQATLAEVHEITYKARDGTDIAAYLAMPPGKQTPVPLVVFPHGGPHDRDYPLFDWRVQFLATRGYAVLQPQFRGSIGFGDHFRDAGDRQWGGLMQDDLTDGVRAMIAQGSIDPHRVCIVGTSGYSGYAALVGAAFTPDLYACAVSINGVTDLTDLMYREVPERGRVVATVQSVWKKQIGQPQDAKSPLHAASAVKVPVLIMYGASGEVPIEQSQAMVRALQSAGKSVKEVALPETAVWWSRTDTRVRVLQELEKFLAEHLQGS